MISPIVAFAGAVVLGSQAGATVVCPGGVVVEEVTPGFVAHRSGVRVGDVLCTWDRAASAANPEPERGVYTSPFDVRVVEIEQTPRGPLTISLIRDGHTLSLSLPMAARDWRLRVAPRQHGRGGGDLVTEAWLLFAAARDAADGRDWEAAEALIDEAAKAAGAVGDANALHLLHDSRGSFHRRRSQWDRAATAYGEALAALPEDGSASLRYAWTLEHLGVMASDRDDLAGAERHHRHALELRERCCPGSMDVASSLSNLGRVAHIRGDLAAAEHHTRRALTIGEALAPESLDTAMFLNNLGAHAGERGDLVTAESAYRRALSLSAALGPGSQQTGHVLSNLAATALDRGDLASAEDYARRSLAIEEGLAPEGGIVFAPLRQLAEIAAARRNFEEAERFAQRALSIQQRVPGGVLEAETLEQLGAIAEARGRPAAAEAHFRRALTIWNKLAPESLGAARCWGALARVSAMLGSDALAEDLYGRALAIGLAIGPDSPDEAEWRHGLADLFRRAGKTESALEQYRIALRILDHQRGRLGGSDEARSRFTDRFAGYYHDAVDLLFQTGNAAEAFAVLERYRARALLILLAERDLTFSTDIPDDLDRERRIANAEYDRALSDLARAAEPDLNPKRAALAAIRTRRAEIADRIRVASPRLAALQSPVPLDATDARAVLDDGTLLLSYSIGARQSHVVALGPGTDDIAAFPLGVSAEALRADVARFRELLEEQSTLQRRRLDSLAARLGQRLLHPVAARLRRAHRVLVLPDGPLHLLPFAALRDPGTKRYLVEVGPLHVAASTTVVAEIKKRRRATPVRLVAFGDPDYSTTRSGRPARASAELRSVQQRGLQLHPLPASRGEVGELRRLFPEKSRVYLGSDATEERAKTEGPGGTILHFACHGLADESFPLESSLALSIPADWKPGQANGLLQAWEIFEQVRLDADLVTLSACDTALGKEMSGEGLLGLTRAFQYAGARSVLSSLWSVRDDSASELMRSFYRHLRGGKTKVEALRAAQIAMIRRFAHPGRWAAFQLSGDWR
jgi:CHAT domain-containing protein/Flp pilus assembly protein TadD